VPRLEFRHHAVTLNEHPKRGRTLDKIIRFTPFTCMLGDMIALFKARKDLPLAKRIASEMIVDGAIDRASWPIVIAKFWMGVGIIALCILGCLFLGLGVATHWTLAIPVLLFGGGVYFIIRVWRGINKGVQAVTDLAKAELGNRVEAIKFPSKPIEEPKT